MDINKIINIYNYFMVTEDSDDIKSAQKVGWNSKTEQWLRFNILFNIGVKGGDSILDWGCGLAHMIDYMEHNKIVDVKYSGIDINTFTVVKAHGCFPNHDIKCGTIADVQNIKYDWVLASGIFSFGVSLDDLLTDVDIAYNVAEKGIAFNCLLPLPDYIEAGFCVYNPKDLLNILSNIYSYVYLVEGYTKDDFTIYITKKPLYETES